MAAVETVLSLQHLAGANARIELIAPDDELVYRAQSVAEPFGGAPAQRYDLAAIAAARGIAFSRDAAVRVDADAQVLHLRSGEERPFDHLVLAPGARQVAAVPGALTFQGSGATELLRLLVEDLAEGRVRRVAFIIPAGAAWTLPIYELALQAGAHAAAAGADAELTLVTPESSPLAAFGPEAGAVVGELLADRGITLRTGSVAEAVIDGRVHLQMEGTFPVDRAIALPRLLGPHIEGLRTDRAGFIPVDPFCRALGHEHIYVVGDAAAQPLKQGGLAIQQGDTAATAIARDLGLPFEPAPYRPVLRGLLLTGGTPLYLRRDPGDAGLNAISEEPLWWPATKVAGGRLGSYLAAHPEFSSPAGPALMALGG